MPTNPENPSPGHTPGDLFNPWRGVCGFYPPDAVNRQKNLTDGQKLLYTRLVRYAGRDGSCYPSFRRLADDLGKSERQIKADVKTLEEQHRLIRHVRRGRQLTNLYQFAWHGMFDSEVQPTAHHPKSEVQPTACHPESDVQDSPSEVQSTVQSEVQPTALESSTRETHTEASEQPLAPSPSENDGDGNGVDRVTAIEQIHMMLRNYEYPPYVPLVKPMQFCGQIFDAGNGASVDDIHAEFVTLWRAKRRPDGWGLFLSVIEDKFGGKTAGRVLEGAPGAAPAAPPRIAACSAGGRSTGKVMRAASRGG